MAIALVGSQTTTASAVSSFSATLPTHSEGDFLLLILTGNYNTSTDPFSVTGWTELAENSVLSVAFVSKVYYKIAGASESNPTVNDSIGTQALGATAIAFSGVDETTPIDAGPSTYAYDVANVTSLVVDGVTTVTDGAWLISCGGSDVTTDQTTVPTGMTSYTTLASGSAHMEVAYQEIATAGATGTKTWTAAYGMELNGVNFALRPASAGGTDNLLANDVQSTSEVTTATLGQVHALLADDIQSTSEVSTVAVGQEHALLGDDVESASEVSAPNLSSVAGQDALLANDIESASEVTTATIGQIHNLLADDLQSLSEVTTATIGQIHAILADDVESISEVSQPAVDRQGIASTIVEYRLEANSINYRYVGNSINYRKAQVTTLYR